mmetsp:Transcript_33904/g.76224  ORF Transcript_33904/g.76224 Transcript_33904/m.76224 type:complete len:348 (-) Transcript_33904:48-1091(-)|eukprot:264992-Hanusia_phi.AAC.1
MPPTPITIDQLSNYFHLPEKQVAAELGMCLTSLKKICRAQGILRWPFRKLKSLERTLKKVDEDKNTISSMTTGCSQPEGLEFSSQHALSHVRARLSASRAASSESLTSNSSPQDESEDQELEDGMNQSCKVWPVCKISEEAPSQIMIKDWSTLWTVHHLRKHLFSKLGGHTFRVSPDGVCAYLTFENPSKALEAQIICVNACAILKQSMRIGGQGETDPSELRAMSATSCRCYNEGENQRLEQTTRPTVSHVVSHFEFEPNNAIISPSNQALSALLSEHKVVEEDFSARNFYRLSPPPTFGHLLSGFEEAEVCSNSLQSTEHLRGEWATPSHSHDFKPAPSHPLHFI